MNQFVNLFKDDVSVFIATVVVCCVLIFILGALAGKLFQKLKDRNEIARQREDAVKRSRAVLGGQFAEQVAPLLPGFPCNPGDARFVGKPVDFVAFPGSAEGNRITEVLFIEVKSGSSQLSEREKDIKSAIENGRVRYVEYHVD